MKLILRKITDSMFEHSYILIKDGVRVDSFIFKSHAIGYCAREFPGVIIEKQRELKGPHWGFIAIRRLSELETERKEALR